MHPALLALKAGRQHEALTLFGSGAMLSGQFTTASALQTLPAIAFVIGPVTHVCVYMLRISMFLYTLHRFLLTVFWASSAHSSHGQAGGRLKQLSLQCFVCICFSAFRIEACDEFHAR